MNTKPDTVTNQDSDESVAARRKFLVGASLGGAGVVAAAVASGGAADLVDAVSGADGTLKKVKGYHVTEHIEQYYATTRL